MATKNKKPCKLQELITEYLTAQAVLNRPAPAPKMPERKAAYSVTEWDRYERDKKDYPLKAQIFHEKLRAAQKRYEKAYAALVMHLPKSHKWFVTENGSHAVALQSCNWPGAGYRIQHRERPNVDLLPELHTVIVP